MTDIGRLASVASGLVLVALGLPAHAAPWPEEGDPACTVLFGMTVIPAVLWRTEKRVP